MAELHLEDDVLFLFFSESGFVGVKAGVSMGGGHEELGSLEEVVLLRVVLEQHYVIVCTWPVCQAPQHLLVVLQSALCGRTKVSETKNTHIVCLH